MKAYGVKRKDQGCCPGHDKYPSQRYNLKARCNRNRRRIQKHRKGSARVQARAVVHHVLAERD